MPCRMMLSTCGARVTTVMRSRCMVSLMPLGVSALRKTSVEPLMKPVSSTDWPYMCESGMMASPRSGREPIAGLGDGSGGVHDLAMREHHTLGIGRGPAGEDDLSDVRAGDSHIQGGWCLRRSSRWPHGRHRRGIQPCCIDAHDGHAEGGCGLRVHVPPGQQQRRPGAGADADGHVRSACAGRAAR